MTGSDQHIQDEKPARMRLDEFVALIHEATVSKQDVTRIVEALGDEVTRYEIVGYLAEKHIAVQSRRGRPAEHPKLDRATAKRIRDDLEALRQSRAAADPPGVAESGCLHSLYDFLSLHADTASEELYAKARETYNTEQQSGRKGAASEAVKSLAGAAMKVFKDAAEKARYDGTLHTEMMEALDGHLEVVGRDTYVDHRELGALFERSDELHVPRYVAEEYIRHYAEKREWQVQERLRPMPTEDLSVCPRCQAQVDRADWFCRECGYRLPATDPSRDGDFG